MLVLTWHQPQLQEAACQSGMSVNSRGQAERLSLVMSLSAAFAQGGSFQSGDSGSGGQWRGKASGGGGGTDAKRAAKQGYATWRVIETARSHAAAYTATSVLCIHCSSNSKALVLTVGMDCG